MRWPLVTRAKYDRQIAFGKVWHDKWQAAEAENRKLRALLHLIEPKLAKFERKRGAGGMFVKSAGEANE